MDKKPLNTSYPHYDQLRKFYINLDSRSDRRASVEAQVGSDFTRVPACFAKECTPEQLAELFDLEYSKQFYQVTLTRGQLGCTISHFQIYQQVVNDATIGEHDWVLISEDDNLFIKDLPARLDQSLNFLKQPRFNGAELVILRYYENVDFYDYADILHKYVHGSREVNASPELQQHIHGLMLDCIPRRPSRRASYFNFSYQGLPPVNDMCTEQQYFITPEHMSPWSSAFYLIRKSTCVRLVNQYKKPWWITDDFQNLVPMHTLLVASPFFAVGATEVLQSDIQSAETLELAQQAQYETAHTRKLRKHSRQKLMTGALKLFYSNNALARLLGRLVYKVFGYYKTHE